MGAADGVEVLGVDPGAVGARVDGLDDSPEGSGGLCAGAGWSCVEPGEDGGGGEIGEPPPPPPGTKLEGGVGTDPSGGVGVGLDGALPVGVVSGLVAAGSKADEGATDPKSPPVPASGVDAGGANGAGGTPRRPRRGGV